MKVHDFRKLGTCTICKDGLLGMAGEDLVRVVTKRDRIGRARESYDAHPSCLDIQVLVTLPDEDIERFNLNNVGFEKMKLVFEEYLRRKKARKRAGRRGARTAGAGR